LTVAIALIALCLEAPNRSAARIVILIINRANPAELVALGEAINLWPASHQIVLV
jgi:rRNA maturation protein Rpf1